MYSSCYCLYLHVYRCTYIPNSSYRRGNSCNTKNCNINVLPLADDDFTHADGKNIFFLETSKGSKPYSPSQMCSIESASLHYPDYRIFLISAFHAEVRIFWLTIHIGV